MIGSRTLATVLLLSGAMACAPPESEQARPVYAATILPLVAIVAEVAGERAQVFGLVPAGSSPHTYAPRPEDVKRIERSRALFTVGGDFDRWAAQLPARERIALFDLVPEAMRRSYTHEEMGEHGHDHGDHDHLHELDTHFWLDPLLVAELVPRLQEQLCRLDPEGCAAYGKNAANFVADLHTLDAALRETLGPVRGVRVIQTHASAGYFLDRYGLESAGVIALAPGKEPSSQDMRRLIEEARANAVRAVLVEPQLSRRPAEVLAREAGLPLVQFDPEGGAPGREGYRDLLRSNADALRTALVP